jgi:peptidoglycan/LPS O-acetylase OafA/YrhL
LSSPPTAPGRIVALDGLRGIAIAAVLAHHFIVPLCSGVIGSPGAYVAASLRLSYTGVDLFFVLSGFLIGGILLDHRESPFLLRTFYLRRFLRIVPLALLCILAVLSAQALGLFGPPEGGDPWPWPVYALFVPNLWMAGNLDWGYRPLSALWSLGIEEQFYLIAPLLVIWVPRDRFPWLLTALIVLAPLSRMALTFYRSDWSFAASLLPVGRTDCLGAGFLVAWMVREPAARAWGERQRGALMAGLLTAAAGMLWLTRLNATNAGLTMALGGYSLVAAFYALILWFTVNAPGAWWTRLLSFPPLVQLGRWSYFVYLFQWLVVGFTVGAVFHHRLAVVTPANWLELAVGGAGLLLAAGLSLRFLEAPLVRWGQRHAY